MALRLPFPKQAIPAMLLLVPFLLTTILLTTFFAVPAIAQDAAVNQDVTEDETTVDDATLEAALAKAGDNRAQLEQALSQAPEAHKRAVRFLIAYMPEDDLQSLTAEYVLTNVDFAYQAREATAWGNAVPEDVFFNDVLPYASINEGRDDWRADFYERFMPMVKECQTPGEAAQVLNKEIFPLLNVSYHATRRPRPNQSPYESIEATYASCSGLSVLLIDACRAVCVPTRFAGTASWTTKPGNHSWVEIWSDGGWHFTGACEYDPNGLDRGWFTADAAQADKDSPRNAIWATSWKTTGDSFPMVWARRDQSVAAVNVTDRYAKTSSDANIPAGKVLVSVDVWTRRANDADNRRRSERVVADVAILAGGEQVAEGKTTGSGDDTNNHLDIVLDPDAEYEISIRTPDGATHRRNFRTSGQQRQQQRFEVEVNANDAVADASSANPMGELEAFLQQPRADRPALTDQPFAKASLTKEQAEQAARLLWEDHAKHLRATRAEEMAAKEFSLGDKTLKYDFTTFGEKPEGGRSLFISMHGGGNAAPRVNDRQWENQKRLYEPAEGVYLAPRAPTNTWNLWHEAHIDPMFDHLIESLVVFEGVNPNRVYVMGYSAGGDGVYQIGTRMADRWAAAAMMAGHPNEAQPWNLRNIGFALHVGAEDGAYNRNQVGRDWGQKLADLHAEDSDGYVTQVQIHEGKAHWMDRDDAVAVPWMAEFTREPRPKKIVWHQDDVTTARFYWLAVDDANKRGGTMVRASVDGQTIEIESEDVSAITVLLDDALVDLDQPVTIRFNGQNRHESAIPRTIGGMALSLAERGDPTSLFYSRVSISRK